MPGRASVEDPLKVWRFKIIVEGFARAGFTEVTGLEKEVEEKTYAEGGMDTDQKSAGRSKYSDVTLKRGQIVGSTKGGDDDFWKWCDDVSKLTESGNAENYRRTITIVQYNAMNQEARRIRLRNAWPKKFKPLSDLKGESSDNSIEELVLAHEGFEKSL